MGKGLKGLIVVLGVLLIVMIGIYAYVKGTYNRLVTLEENVKGAWAQVENQLQRRFDLIPNYVETVKGYAAHEKEVLVRVTEARARVAGAATLGEKIEANNELTSALGRLLVVVERYPELKANTNFIRLQDELAGTENRIAVERMRFNDVVKTYNIAIRQFPTRIIAGMFGFEKAAFFDVPKERQEAPKVKF